MSFHAAASVLILLLWAAPVCAEERINLPTASERHAASIASWATLIAGQVLDTKASFESPDRKRALTRQGMRLGITLGAVLAAKAVVHRQRPCVGLPEGCGSDQPETSWFSGHTAIACSAMGNADPGWSFSMCFATAGLRVGAGKHWPTDVLTGLGVGWATSRLR